MKIGYQGIEGSYSELALMKHFSDVEKIGYETFDEVFEAVVLGEIDHGIIPVENTIAGTVVENFDMLLSEDVMIIAETYLPIKHQLLARKGVGLEDVKKAYSHPHALKQCKKFLKEKGIKPMIYTDTAASAKMISESDGKMGAIASSLCAEIYGLDILAEDINSNSGNETRFFVIVKRGDIKISEKTSLALKTKHYPGALVDCLKIFQLHNINLSKLESRPIPENPWEYVFYVDIESEMGPEIIEKALDILKKQADVKILGSYTKCKK